MNNDNTMITGSCLCGRVQYEYRSGLDQVVICHCGQCKKAQGSAFATNAPVMLSLFSIKSGEELLRTYRSSPAKRRVFCSNCGSPIYSAHDDKPELLRLRLGTIDSTLKYIPDYQQFDESKVDWLEWMENIPVIAKTSFKSK